MKIGDLDCSRSTRHSPPSSVLAAAHEPDPRAVNVNGGAIALATRRSTGTG